MGQAGFRLLLLGRAPELALAQGLQWRLKDQVPASRLQPNLVASCANRVMRMDEENLAMGMAGGLRATDTDAGVLVTATIKLGVIRVDSDLRARVVGEVTNVLAASHLCAPYLG